MDFTFVMQIVPEELTCAILSAPLLQLHLGMALCRQGDAARGKPLIRKALASKADLLGAEEARKLVEAG